MAKMMDDEVVAHLTILTTGRVGQWPKWYFKPLWHLHTKCKEGSEEEVAFLETRY